MLVCMFGYMDLLIVIKWLTDFGSETHNAPGIISIMLSMFLGGGEVTEGVALFPG